MEVQIYELFQAAGNSYRLNKYQLEYNDLILDLDMTDANSDFVFENRILTHHDNDYKLFNENIDKIKSCGIDENHSTSCLSQLEGAFLQNNWPIPSLNTLNFEFVAQVYVYNNK